MSSSTCVTLVHHDGNGPGSAGARMKTFTLTGPISSQRRDLVEAFSECAAFGQVERDADDEGHAFDAEHVVQARLDAIPCLINEVRVCETVFDEVRDLRNAILALRGRGRTVEAFIHVG